ncbi:SNO glutamine amidotransferase [Fistulina hepatica ATCC 64428]|uniref:glutaminase n=1 Tax=Fistulina hepatica ATCC 64428 TaxID=1128425 RepID=A0A0D7APR2_9AGAR|nr:SNO glutamine amidotransferase [Fistulina hepatica ATCC 64428]
MVDTKVSSIVIGVLALQGAFIEHQAMLQRLSLRRHIVVVQVRTPEDLARCDGLIIPGGESTTMALLARKAGLIDPLCDFVRKKPVWGTCAGAILMSRAVINTKKGGQEVLGGMSLTIARNGWGSQIESFEAPLQVSDLRDEQIPFNGIFIRAPVILKLEQSPNSPPIHVIARLPHGIVPTLDYTTLEASIPSSDRLSPSRNAAGPDSDIVAIRQGRHLLTTFHPELTSDDRFHEYFVEKCVLQQVLAN